MLPGIQGLVGGSFHFSQILGQGAGAILRGVPLKIVMVFDTRPLNWLFARKEIRSLQELKGGKQIAVSSFGAALDQMTRDLLPKRGIDPQKDVVLRAIEPTPARLAALDERRRRRRGGQPDGPHHREEERFQRVALLRRRFGIRHRGRRDNRKTSGAATGVSCSAFFAARSKVFTG